MRLDLECFPCLFKQINRTSKLITDDKLKVKKIIDEFGDRLKEIDFNMTPPEAGVILYKMINDILKVRDPYKKIKEESINLGLELYPELNKIIENTKNKLKEAVKIAIAGNIIDFGAQEEFDIRKELFKIKNQNIDLKDYEIFKNKVEKANRILVIGDNAGETVFDKILIEQLTGEIIYAVRGFPVINDATKEDAINSGLDKVAKIITTGSNIPGVIIDKTSDEFKNYFYNSEVIISKGQGNYETLSDIDRDIFFLFKIKCFVVSKVLRFPVGTSVLHYKR